MSVFAVALDALFMAPGSDAALYRVEGLGPPQPIRVIRSQPDRLVGSNDASIILGTNIFEIRKSEVAEPTEGDTLEIDEQIFVLQPDAQIDTEGLTWTVGAEIE